MIERVSFMFERFEFFFSLHLLSFTDSMSVQPYVFLWDFARETGARPARLDPRARVQSLTAVLLL